MKHQSEAALKNLIRELRDKLYWKTQHSFAHERVWETEEEEESREERNKDCRNAWDEGTEALIRKCYDE